MDKIKVSKILNEIGIMLELKGENVFKTRAYYDGARIIEALDEDLTTLVSDNRLKDIKGIGSALNQKISELVKTGELAYYNDLKKETPEGLFELMKIPNVGAKKTKAIYQKLGITSIEELEKACLENKVAKLSGFGEKTQQKILEGIQNIRKYKGYFLYPVAKKAADELLEYLKKNQNIIRIELCGSLRRKKEIIKDIDILVSAKNNQDVLTYYKSYPLVESIIAEGGTKVSITLKNGINVDLRIVSDDEFPYALHHFTGSKEHNTKMRHNAKKNNMKMNEYGLFKVGELIKCRDENEIFAQLGMDYVEPELREDHGEVEAALASKLPGLIQYNDLKGFVHVHTVYSDGENSIKELADYVYNLGQEYLVISDHSRSAFYANGLAVDRVKMQHEEIDKLNELYKDKVKIFKGIEMDILLDGEVDYDEKTLATFDLRIASIHTSFNLDEDKMTMRVIKALKNKYVDILGHPTGRLLLLREAYKINMNEVIKVAIEEGVVIEINSWMERLDLDWRYAKKAKEAGGKFVISSDAHSFEGIDNTQYGVNIARKGWLEKGDVVNCLSKEEFLAAFRKK